MYSNTSKCSPLFAGPWPPRRSLGWSHARLTLCSHNCPVSTAGVSALEVGEAFSATGRARRSPVHEWRLALVVSVRLLSSPHRRGCPAQDAHFTMMSPPTHDVCSSGPDMATCSGIWSYMGVLCVICENVSHVSLLRICTERKVDYCVLDGLN